MRDSDDTGVDTTGVPLKPLGTLPDSGDDGNKSAKRKSGRRSHKRSMKKGARKK